MPDVELRRCIGSARFGIEPHEAPINAFPAQPSQKDGLGRMCATHWRAYTAGLARDARARKAPAEGVVTGETAEPEAATTEPPARRHRAKAQPAPENQPGLLFPSRTAEPRATVRGSVTSVGRTCACAKERALRRT
jgi:hypothetical protein